MSRPFLVDSHCHLDFPDFDAERDELIARASAEGVGFLLTISTFVARFERIRAFIERYPNVCGSIGTHPHNAAEEPDTSPAHLIEISRHPKIVAIGEAGLDYHYDKAPRDVQARVFRTHIAASRETGLPLVIHSRDADDDMIAILRDETAQGAFPFVLHCFSSGARLATRGIELGGYVSFSGIVAFGRSADLRAIAATIPPDRLLIETDAPYLAPPPFRGRRNEPAYVRFTAERLAQSLEMEASDLASRTSDNFFRLFSKAKDPRRPAAEKAAL